MSFFQWEHTDLLLSIHVQPRSSRSGVVGVQGDRLKIKLTSPPIEGQANAEVCQLLAKLFGVAKSHIILLSGETSRDKRLRIKSPKKLPDFITTTEL